MKKTIFAILLALALVLIPVGSAFAATTQDVVVTASPDWNLSIDNTPATADFLAVAMGSTPNTGEDHFTITDNGNVDVTVGIVCNGWGVPGAGIWTYGAPGTDTGSLNASNGGGYSIAVDATTPTELISHITVGLTATWGLQLNAPTLFTFGDLQTTTVTLSASQDIP